MTNYWIRPNPHTARGGPAATDRLIPRVPFSSIEIEVLDFADLQVGTINHRGINVGPHWTNIKSTLGQLLVFATKIICDTMMSLYNRDVSILYTKTQKHVSPPHIMVALCETLDKITWFLFVHLFGCLSSQYYDHLVLNVIANASS